MDHIFNIKSTNDNSLSYQAELNEDGLSISTGQCALLLTEDQAYNLYKELEFYFETPSVKFSRNKESNKDEL